MIASIWRHRWPTLLLGLLGVLTALGIAQILTPRYPANAVLLVDPRDLRVLENEVTPRAGAAENASALVESQARVLQSDSVLKRAVAALGLDKDPEFNGSRKGALRSALAPMLDAIKRLRGSSDEPSNPSLAALQTLERRITVRRPDRTYVVDVGVWSEDRLKAVTIANAIVKAYLQDQAEARSNPATSVGDTIDAGLEALRRRVAEAEGRVAKYKVDNNLVGASGRLVNEQQLTEINNQLVTARSDLGRAKARFDEANRLKDKPDSIPEALSSAGLRALRQQLAAITSQKARLASQLRPQHPVMASILLQEREVLGLIREELNRIVQSAGVDYERAKSVETSLTAELERLRTQMNQSDEAQIKLRELNSELEANRAVYQAAFVRAREARQQAQVNTANVRIISEPTPAIYRSFPPSPVFLLPLGLILGLGCGMMLGFARDAMAGRSEMAGPVASPSLPPRVEPRAAAMPAPAATPRDRSSPSYPPTGEASLTRRRPITPRTPTAAPAAEPVAPPPSRRPQPMSIPLEIDVRRPASAPPKSMASTGDEPRFIAADLRGIGPAPASRIERHYGPGPGYGNKPAAVVESLALNVLERPQSPISQKIARLADHLDGAWSSKTQAGKPRTLIVAAAEPNPIKTVVALGLANVMSAAGKRVLLVDADLESAYLTDTVHRSRQFGSETVMAGKAPLASVLIKRQQSPLDVVPAGAADALRGRGGVSVEGLQRLLRQAGRYDVVIVDAPAMSSGLIQDDFLKAANQLVMAMMVEPAGEDELFGRIPAMRAELPAFAAIVLTD